jgi:hypothetical protein
MSAAKPTAKEQARYCGQLAEFYELRTAGEAGRRVHVHTWIEDGKQGVAGSGLVRILEGQHRSVECLFKTEFDPGGQDQAVAVGVAELEG